MVRGIDGLKQPHQKVSMEDDSALTIQMRLLLLLLHRLCTAAACN